MPKPGSNGYGAMDSYKRNNGTGSNNNGNNGNNGVSNSINNAKKKQKKKATREVLKKAASAINPAVGKAVDIALKTKKGDQLVDEFAKGQTTAEGVARVADKIKKDALKTKILITIGPPVLILFFLIMVIPVIFKNADSQTFGNDNGGDVEKVKLAEDDTDHVSDIFGDYPQLYETINKAVYEYSNQYGVDIDRFLIISTLAAPLENGFFYPYDCTDLFHSGKECTRYLGEEILWDKFLESWGYNAYLLSAMQMMTYSDYDDTLCKTKNSENMQLIAENDNQKKSCWSRSLFSIGELDINAFECWFAGAETKAKMFAEREMNVNCTKAVKADKKDDYPRTRVLSIDEGEYEVIKSGDLFKIKEKPETGGVYFWNLVNETGFIYNYLTKYQIAQDSEDAEDNDTYDYDEAKVATYDLASYIYDYYYSIRKDCRSLEIVPQPTTSSESGASSVQYDESVESQVLSLLKKYYVPGYKNMDYYKALSIILRSNILNGSIVPDADKIGETDENQGLAKSDYDDSIDNDGIDFNDLVSLIQSSYGTKGIIITEKNQENKNKAKDRIIKKIEIDEFSPQTYIPVDFSLKDLYKNNDSDKLVKGNNFFLDKLQRELPVMFDKIDFYVSDYDENEGSKKIGIDCPSFYLPENRPKATNLQDVDTKEPFRSCEELEKATDPENYKLYYAVTTNNIKPKQKVRGKCFTVTSCVEKRSMGNTYLEAELEYHPGRLTDSPDYNESETARGVSTVALRYFADQGYNWRGLLRLFLDRTKEYDDEDEYHVTFKRIATSLQEGECQNHGYTKENITTKTEKCDEDDECKLVKKDTRFKKW